ncbi:MAG: gamma carbonic anhydrase family protein [Candidatus Krumholzibacteria bacterium]|nr:gamma carbonic anhydrase family protein [Candidatus Krumholzibacteria bacterium]
MIEPFQGMQPSIGDDVFVAATAQVIGDVEIGDCASVWHGAIVRGDVRRIHIGAYTNIQDLCVCHVTTGGPDLVIGSRVTVGHRAILHSCTIGDGCLIGMGAVILDGVKIGGGSIVAAGSVLLQGLDVPPRSLVAGVPGTVKKTIDSAASERLAGKAEEYHELALAYLGKRRFERPERRT